MCYTGTSKLDWAVALTAVKRALREHVNDEIEASKLDCASPLLRQLKDKCIHNMYIETTLVMLWTVRLMIRH